MLHIAPVIPFDYFQQVSYETLSNFYVENINYLNFKK